LSYQYDTDTIHVTPIPNKQAATIRNAWQSTYKTLISSDYSMKHHVLDNECSLDLEVYRVRMTFVGEYLDALDIHSK